MGRIKQSVAAWCFLDRQDIKPAQFVQAVADIGFAGVELLDQEYWPLVKNYGLRIVAAKGHEVLRRGLNKREHHDQIEKEILTNLELAQRWDIPNLIVFSGTRDGQDDQEGAEITAEGLKRVAGAAEAAGVTLVLELLNSKIEIRDYQCDHTAWGVNVCKMVDSTHVKLLYDIYHMQIMEGDIINTIHDYFPYFGHYHTGGNPGRHELDGKQELNYAAIIQAIHDVSYADYVGHEFIPTSDPVTALKHAFDLCN